MGFSAVGQRLLEPFSATCRPWWSSPWRAAGSLLCTLTFTAGTWGNKPVEPRKACCRRGFGEALCSLTPFCHSKQRKRTDRAFRTCVWKGLESLWKFQIHLQTQLWKINPWGVEIFSSPSPEINGSVSVSVLRENFLSLRSLLESPRLLRGRATFVSLMVQLVFKLFEGEGERFIYLPWFSERPESVFCCFSLTLENS